MYNKIFICEEVDARDGKGVGGGIASWTMKLKTKLVGEQPLMSHRSHLVEFHQEEHAALAPSLDGFLTEGDVMKRLMTFIE